MSFYAPAEPPAWTAEQLLRSVPERWAAFEHDGLTSVAQRALLLLTASGPVEGRFALRIEMAGQSGAIEAAAASPFRVAWDGSGKWRFTEHGVMARADLKPERLRKLNQKQIKLLAHFNEDTPLRKISHEDAPLIVREGMGDDLSAIRREQVDRPQHHGERSALHQRRAR